MNMFDYKYYVSDAPGAPGIDPTWSSSDKDLVGTAMGSARLWYTIGHGILNEVYYPRIDIPQIRDMGFIIADDKGFWVEVKRLPEPDITTPDAGIPLPTIVFQHERFTLTLRICPDPKRDVLLIDVNLEGDDDLRPYVLLAPHMGGTGWKNQAEVNEYHGKQVLWAEQGPFGLALLACNHEFEDAMDNGSAGYVGFSDAWQDFSRNGAMTWHYPAAGPGNVSLCGKLQPRCTLGLGLATSKEAAATLALSTLACNFDTLLTEQIEAWQNWHYLRDHIESTISLPEELQIQIRHSAQVLKSHQDKTYAGAIVASLSVPWGNYGEERGGYHLVWPRDLVECAQALLALGCADEARDTLRYLMATQNSDGHWLQNQWLGGKPYWQGVQLDETAFPILLTAQLAEQNELDGIAIRGMLRRALKFLITSGPSSDQDRWEEDAGLNPYTLSVCIAALVCAADLLDGDDATLATTVADYWNARLENWCLSQDTQLDKQYGLKAHYIRQAPAEILDTPNALCRVLPIKNLQQDPNLPASTQIGTGFLQLVRMGLRRANDPYIVDSLKLVDELLKTDTPNGPVWHRYNGDGYGEHPDGQPFDGTGQGRGWPLLTGERGHYALAAGDNVLPYLKAMNAMTGRNGLIPEQVWDTSPLPEYGLKPGHPSGSAMPLAWAHAEFVKLASSSTQDHASDRPMSVWQRYKGIRPDPECWVWSLAAPLNQLPPDKDLLLIFSVTTKLHFGFDDWHDISDRDSHNIGLGLQGVLLKAKELQNHSLLNFTLHCEDGSWLGRNFNIQLGKFNLST